MSFWRSLGNAVAALTQSDSVGALLARLGMLRGTTAEASETVAFTIALVALAAKIARSDGVATGDEYEAFKRIIDIPEDEERNVRRLFDLAKRDVAGYETYARQIGLLLKDAAALRREVLEGLFFVAAADGVLHDQEEAHLQQVARHLGLASAEYGYARSLFFDDAMTPYAILGATPATTDADLKARYRMLVRENHPDRLIGRGLSKDFIAAAERRLAAINQAYDTVTRERAAGKEEVA